MIFLLILSLVVCLREVAAARGESGGTTIARHGAHGQAPAAAAAFVRSSPAISIAIEESPGLLAASDRLRRTLAVRRAHAASGALELDWEARVGGAATAGGREHLPGNAGSGLSRVALSVPLPPVERPSGIDLTVRVRDAGSIVCEATFPFVVYPAEAGRHIQDLFGRARVALFDPEGAAARPLHLLGLAYQEVASPEGLALFDGDLIVVGPGGFTRGREALGPILAARARSGVRVLVLDQPTLPGTLSEEIRLWPSFSTSPPHSVLLSAEHPILRGLTIDGGADFFAAASGEGRPLLPPARGNFRVLAAVRVASGPSWQEGVSLLELPIGAGTVILAQAGLCVSFDRDPRPRILLANALAYLLGERPLMKHAALYAAGPESLPLCLRHLALYAPPAPADLEGVDLLLVPGDWQALRDRSSARLAPLAQAARFLHDGGTMILFNPQSLVLDYLTGLTGATVYFEPADRASASSAGPGPSGILEGIAVDDLALLKQAGQAEFRLRSRPGPDSVEPLFVAPAIARYRVGRGTLVALTLPQASECATTQVSSLLARLLTNLGVPLDPEPGVDPEAVTLLNEATNN